MAVLDDDIGKEVIITSSSRGVGDTIAKAIKTVSGGTVRPCSGCKKRQATLNRIFPYKPESTR